MLLRAVALLVFVLIALFAIRSLFRMLLVPTREADPTTGAERLARDPVCGTYVPRQIELSVRDEFFCSEECRSKFLNHTR